jgi:hypothetical protein
MPRQQMTILQMPPPMSARRKRSWWNCSATPTSRSSPQSTRWRLTLQLRTAQGRDVACSISPSNLTFSMCLAAALNKRTLTPAGQQLHREMVGLRRAWGVAGASTACCQGGRAALRC